MTGWTHAGEYLPWLTGTGFHVAHSSTQSAVSDGLAGAGYALATADTSTADSRYDAYRSIADALYLPTGSGANLDALVDGLRELSERWPDAARLVLLWSGADALVRADLLGWTTLGQALMTAVKHAWSPLRGQPVVFETVAFVGDGFGADHL
ncbi:MAG: barstar family protein [Frankiales bacterium]|nr:barstar family protein [Frankiales bacterium]